MVALLVKAVLIYRQTFTANESTIPRECVALITAILSAYSQVIALITIFTALTP